MLYSTAILFYSFTYNLYSYITIPYCTSPPYMLSHTHALLSYIIVISHSTVYPEYILWSIWYCVSIHSCTCIHIHVVHVCKCIDVQRNVKFPTYGCLEYIISVYILYTVYIYMYIIYMCMYTDICDFSILKIWTYIVHLHVDNYSFF